MKIEKVEQIWTDGMTIAFTAATPPCAPLPHQHAIYPIAFHFHHMDAYFKQFKYGYMGGDGKPQGTLTPNSSKEAGVTWPHCPFPE